MALAQVQCSVCSTVTSALQANQVGHVVCQGCQVSAGTCTDEPIQVCYGPNNQCCSS